MPLNYTVANDQGTVGKVSTSDVVQQLQKAGHQITGITPDGQTVQMQDQQGPFTTTIPKVLEQLGWKTSRIEPTNVNYDAVDPMMRAMVTSAPEHLKHAVLSAELQDRGIENAQVVGSGRDWYVFNPQTNRYVALTNDAKHFGGADVAEGMIEGGRGLASAFGGAVGATLGGGTPASIALGAAGAGLGSGIVDAGTKALLGSIDPAYKGVALDNLDSMGWDTAGKMTLDAAGGGLAAGLPIAARAAGAMMKPGMGQTLARGAEALGNAGPVSRGLRATGEAMDTAGGVVGDVAQFMRKPGVGDIVNMGDPTMLTGFNGVPLTGDLEGLGYLAQGAEEGPRFGVKAMGNLGQKWGDEEGLKGTIGRGASKASQALSAARGTEEQLAAGPSFNTDPRTIYGNAFEHGAKAAGNLGGPMGQRRQMLQNFIDAGEYLPKDSPHFAQAQAELARRAKVNAFAKHAGHVGEKVGHFAGQTATMGRGMVKTGRGIYNAGMGAVQYGGRGAQATGKVLSGLGAQTAPLENQIYAHYGAEEMLPSWQEQDPWRLGRRQDTMDPTTLAQNY